MAPKIHQINITAAGFPANTTIAQYDSVFFANNTAQPHQPAPDGGTPTQWVPGPVRPNGESPQVVFNSTGTFAYHCVIHTNEKGTITVS
jgi:plastocyanin